ncbi:MAG: hypothetical protein OHK93_005593 [Ramalina farinacea]|uniref:Glycosyltransferase 2 n=1 Tax=Ramalina farinacea TaxID=258253 RepID=A0AA43QGZ2_9LECA|nr:hypothetical protein [Ramalina farinacea]
MSSWPGRFFADDEEMGKKNDDHRPNGPSQPAPWSVRKPAPAVRKRRILYLLGFLLFAFLFIRNLPTDLGPRYRMADTRLQPLTPPDSKLVKPQTDPQKKKPPKPAGPTEAEEHYFDGPIKFYKLAATLYAATKLRGDREFNKNVLFAASSLKSLSELLPLACEMARWERSDVHVVIMGRDDMDLQEIRQVNGVAEDGCPVHWHDARPDYSRWSTNSRMESSVAAGLDHVHNFVHPQVILVDDSDREDDFFIDAVRTTTLELSKSLIELPANAMESLMWITRLDSASLAAWPMININILIQPPSGSSASIVRLLRSLESADYFGARYPHLTIELPEDTDAATSKYLENIVWPPIDWSGSAHMSQVTIRHRVRRKTTSPEEASARLVESFYPKRLVNSHVLLLSPQVELSPLYYHYLLYTILEFKYSSHAVKAAKDDDSLMGISLDLPTVYLNDTTRFLPPITDKLKSRAQEEGAPFRWQSPNNNAALYFGDKWKEFHSFLAGRLTKPPSRSPKAVSSKHPAWLEYMSELMRARGYSLLYPGDWVNETALSTIHDELYQVPEEFLNEPVPSDRPVPEISQDEPLEANVSRGSRKPPPNDEHPLLESSLTSLLPNQGDFPALNKVPHITFEGKPVDRDSSFAEAVSFTKQFLGTIGGCQASETPPGHKSFQAIDLFCHVGEPYDFYVPDDAAAAEAAKSKPAASLPVNDRVFDADVMKPGDAETAKAEAAHHLNRQSGNTDSGSSSLEQKTNEKDKVAPKVAAVEDEKAKEAPDREAGTKKAMEKSTLAKEGKSDEPPQEPKRGAFDKETPKPADEKGPGW